VEGSVSRRGRVDVFGKSVGALKIAASPVARDRCLQRVVDRIGVVGEDLVAAVTVEARRGRAGNGIGKSVSRDGEVLAAGGGDSERMGNGVHRLDAVARVAKMESAGADVAYFKNPFHT